MSRALAIVVDSVVDGLCWKQLLGLNTIEEMGVEPSYFLGAGSRNCCTVLRKGYSI